MNRLAPIFVLALVLLVLATAAWTVQGIRWALTRSRRRRGYATA